LDILIALWRLGPSTVREVHEALDKPSGYTTTLKQMQVMTEKGLLVRNERHRTHIYQPRDSMNRTRREIAGDLMKRAFGGSPKELMLGALAAKQATDEELSEIRRILDDLARKRGLK
jgi:predicted transcriptional regulator